MDKNVDKRVVSEWLVISIKPHNLGEFFIICIKKQATLVRLLTDQNATVLMIIKSH